MTGDFDVVVRGLDGLHRALSRLAGRVDDHLEQLDEWAAGEVADQARSGGQARGGVVAKAAPAVQAVNNTVALDDGAYPFALGAEYGAKAFPQFEPYVGPDAGYFVHPAVDDSRERIADHYDDGAAALVKEAGL